MIGYVFLVESGSAHRVRGRLEQWREKKDKKTQTKKTQEQRKRILLVEDQVAIRNLYQLFLEQNNFLVLAAGGVQEAVRVARETEFDLALLDVYLEDGNGLELSMKLKGAHKVPTILMTGFNSDDQL